jgi:hypothetical protein
VKRRKEVARICHVNIGVMSYLRGNKNVCDRKVAVGKYIVKDHNSSRIRSWKPFLLVFDDKHDELVEQQNMNQLQEHRGQSIRIPFLLKDYARKCRYQPLFFTFYINLSEAYLRQRISMMIVIFNVSNDSFNSCSGDGNIFRLRRRP